MDCIFCKIANDEIPSLTIYEDDLVKVFLDLNPDTNGHSLIIPKKHYETIEDIDRNTLNHINEVALKMYKLFKEKLNCEGLSINQNNDYGQEVRHYHLHLLPRYKDDNYHSEKNGKVLITKEEIYNKIMS